MQRYFYSPADGSYAGAHERPNRAQAWPFSQALWATLDIAAIPKARPRCPRRPARADPRAVPPTAAPSPARPAEYAPVFGGSGVVYNDDNLWIAQALVGSSSSSAGQAIRDGAHLFRLVEDSWDMNAADPCPGGVFWTRRAANRDRNR